MASHAEVPKYRILIRTVVMRRIADEDVALSDGTTIPKDYQMAVASTARLRDPSVYPDPDTFGPYRFLNPRQTAPIKETYAQATAPSPVTWDGRLGTHACPGRNLVVRRSRLFFVIFCYSMIFSCGVMCATAIAFWHFLCF